MAISNGAVLAKNSFPQGKSSSYAEAKRVANFVVTSYTSSVEETDDTPYVTASGTFVRPGVAASNVLPFGTKFRVPELFGDMVFVIEDRMNSRYNGKNWVDIWFDNKTEAQVFGKKVSEIEIL
jgi:3D (Asp-Asp-Asp) domain-containing protein